MQRRNNVVELRPGRLTASAIEDIETILLMQLGREVTIDQVEFTPKSIDQFISELGLGSSTEIYVFPVKRWTLKDDLGRELLAIAIETGSFRVFYSTVRR